MPQSHELHVSEMVTLNGPHGAYASIRLDHVKADRAQLTISTYQTTAKAGSPPGPLSMETCQALLTAVLGAREKLDANRAKYPELLDILASLTRAEQLAARELHVPGKDKEPKHGK